MINVSILRNIWKDMVLKSLKVPSKFCFSNKFRNSKYNELIWKYVAACCIFNINNNHLYHSETKKCRSASLKWRRIMCVTPLYKIKVLHYSQIILSSRSIISQNSVFFCFQLFKKNVSSYSKMAVGWKQKCCYPWLRAKTTKLFEKLIM